MPLYRENTPPLTLTLSPLWVERGMIFMSGGDQIPFMMVWVCPFARFVLFKDKSAPPPHLGAVTKLHLHLMRMVATKMYRAETQRRKEIFLFLP
jgi:hypothetical protein